MFSLTIKTNSHAVLISTVFAGMFLTACQTTHDEMADVGNVRPETINFRSDLYHASFSKVAATENMGIEREDSGSLNPKQTSTFARQHRVLIPIKRSGQKQLDDVDSYLLPLIDTLSSWNTDHGVIIREVKVVGHTDSEGSELSNMLLSLRRANAVADRLEELGVEAGLLRIEAYGEEQPIGDNTSMGGRIANRRVEIVVTAYPQAPVPGNPLFATYSQSDRL